MVPLHDLKTSNRLVSDAIIFTGMIQPNETVSIIRRLTSLFQLQQVRRKWIIYLESIVSGTPITAHGNPYLDQGDWWPHVAAFMRSVLIRDPVLFKVIEEICNDEIKWAEKIDDIFLQQPFWPNYEFYLDKIISMIFLNDLNPEQSRVKDVQDHCENSDHIIAFRLMDRSKAWSNRWSWKPCTISWLKKKLSLQNFFDRAIITDRDISNLGNLIESAGAGNRVEW